MDNDKTIFVSSDHNGNAARAHIVEYLHEIGLNGVDVGADYDVKVDYPDMARDLCLKVINTPGSRGILLCGTGTGMLIAANRFPEIRAGLATDKVTAQLMRRHNDCNVLVLGQWRTPLGEMGPIIKTFVETPFEGGRHTARVSMLGELF